jgi:hypothetical protein
MKKIIKHQRVNQNKENHYRKGTKILISPPSAFRKIQLSKVLFYKILEIKVVSVILGVL